jgi:hypothetical protein
MTRVRAWTVRVGALAFSKRKGILTVTDARTLKKLTRAHNALKPPPPSGTQARKCPNDDGTTVLAGFSYPNGFQTWVTLEVTGCQT